MSLPLIEQAPRIRTYTLMVVTQTGRRLVIARKNVDSL